MINTTELSIVVPTYNEAESIPKILDGLKNLDVDVLVIDDGSPDGTAEIVRARNIEVIERAGKQGLGSAYRTGFAIGIERGYTYIIEMDADGSHQIKDLEKMMEWIGSSDLLIGSRWVADGAIENWSKFREYLSNLPIDTLICCCPLELGIQLQDLESIQQSF